MIDEELEQATLTQLLVVIGVLAAQAQNAAMGALPSSPQGRTELAARLAASGEAIATLARAAMIVVTGADQPRPKPLD